MNHPLLVTFNEALQTFTIDHVNRRHLNKVQLIYLRAPRLTAKDVRTCRPVSRECYFDRERDIIYLGDDEYKLACEYFKMAPADYQRHFKQVLMSCGLASWIQAVS